MYLIPVDEKLPKPLKLHSDWDVASTSDGKWLISGSRDKTTKISSVETLSLLRSIDQSAEIINAIAGDPLTATSGGNAKTLIAYDFKLALTGVEVGGSGNGARPTNNRDQYARNFEPQPEAITALATSGDRKLLAVTTRAAEMDTRARKSVLSKVPTPALSVALSRDGTRLMLGSKTGEVQIWDTSAASVKMLKALVPVPVREAAGVAVK